MEKAQYLEALREESEAFMAATVASPDASVAQCGDWTNRDLAIHLASVWQFAAANVLGGGEQSGPTDPWPADSSADPTAWVQQSSELLVAALTAADPTDPAWAFAADNQTAGFWHRRMVHETAVHRWDAQSATNTPSPITALIAADGIDEYTQVSLRYSGSRPDRTYPAQSLHLHCTDTEGEWTLLGDDGPNVTVRREHAKGDAAVRGEASALLLWIWGRDGGDVEIFGDADVAERWRALAP